MSILALALILVSAGCHASWNYLAQSSRDKFAFSWAFSLVASVLYLPVALYFGLTVTLTTEAWLFILGTILLHAVYFYALNQAYTHGDLSLTYPIARGSGMMLVPILAAIALDERISIQGALAILVILAGIFIAHQRGGVRTWLTDSKRALGDRGTRYALLTGLTIACYSVWDKHGVSLSPAPFYAYFIFLSWLLLGGIDVLLRRRPALKQMFVEHKREIVAAGVLAPLAYGLVLTALTFSRVSYVAPARELGVVIGAVMGIVIGGEPHGQNRIFGASLIAAGVIALALAP